jgi:hypothetical protein
MVKRKLTNLVVALIYLLAFVHPNTSYAMDGEGVLISGGLVAFGAFLTHWGVSMADEAIEDADKARERDDQEKYEDAKLKFNQGKLFYFLGLFSVGAGSFAGVRALFRPPRSPSAHLETEPSKDTISPTDQFFFLSPNPDTVGIKYVHKW